MDDIQIIDLYWKRNEAAIAETDKKYGRFCRDIAQNILCVREDAEECVSDTYFQAWTHMPPERPNKLRAWLGRIVRNLSLNLWNKNHAKKRYAGIEQIFDELEECIPAPKTVERELEEKELSAFIDNWLAGLSRENRVLFLRRYFQGESVKKLAGTYGMTSQKCAKCLYGLRQSLRAELEKEGYFL